jgi:tRNA (guanine37-N1)-methyltransferase
MKITILTLFPQMFAGPFDLSIIKNAKDKGLVEIDFVNIRDFGIGKHQMVDDTAYGGGVGMVMKVDVLHQAIEHAKSLHETENRKIILMSAAGETFNQKRALDFAKLDHLIIICGHYEGIDARIQKYIDAEISIGDFVLTGGEIPAMLIADAVTRLIPGVLPEGATENESFSLGDGEQLLEYPHYTKPQEYDGQVVPEILLSGNHPEVAKWKEAQAKEKTSKLRPDLLKK